MHFPKSLLFLVIFLFLYQTGVAQISQGTLVFKEEFYMDWEAFEKMMLSAYAGPDENSGNSAEEIAQGKEEWSAFVNTQIMMLKGKAALTENDSTIYYFDENQAVVAGIRDEKPIDEFVHYDLDSLQLTIYSLQGGKTNKRVIPSTFENSWRNIRDSVVIDNNDVKDILGFQCVKYYLFHSHDLGTNKTAYHYELYVTNAIKFPFFIMDHAITSSIFSGCALEIKHIGPEPLPFQSTKRATSFNRQVDTSKFVLPEKFKE